MLKTAKPRSEGQAFHRKLLSEYNTDFTLDNYVAYFKLKPIAKEVEHLRQNIEKHLNEKYYNSTSTGAASNKRSKGSITCYNNNNNNNNNSSSSSINETTTPILQVLRREGTETFADIHSPLSANSPEMLFPDDLELSTLCAKRKERQNTFFKMLEESYKTVKKYIINLEKELLECMEELHRHTDTDLRHMNADYIPSLYLKVDSIVRYRELNLLAFRRIMRKFLERCASDSLQLQQRVFMVDTLIVKSNVAQPTIDLRGIALELIALYGMVFKLNYEESVTRLSQYGYRVGINVQRILPNCDTFFFSNIFPHQERPGQFAIRVLAGSGNLFAEKMITEVLQCPRMPGNCCTRFANGETSVKLPGSVRGDDTFLVQSMVAVPEHNLSTSDSVMELALMIHAAELASAARITAVIPYLAYTRNVASIAALAEIIECMGCNRVITVDMRSEQVEGMFSIPMECISAKYEFVRYLVKQLESEGNDFANLTIVAPTGDSLGRAKDFADAMMRFAHLDSTTQFVSVCTAVKRVEPGEIHGNKYQRGRRLMNTDDLMREIASMEINPSTNTDNINNSNNKLASDTLIKSETQDGKVDKEQKSPLFSEPGVIGEYIDEAYSPPRAERGESENNNNSHNRQCLSQVHYDPHVSSELSPPMPYCEQTTRAIMSSSPLLITKTNTNSTNNNVCNSAEHNPAIAEATQNSVSTTFTPTVADKPIAELMAVSTQWRQNTQLNRDGNVSESETRSSSTLGIEMALKRQERGIHAILTHVVEETWNEFENIVLVGDVRDRLCVIVDSSIDEALYISLVAKSLKAHGASRIILIATHAVICGKGKERLLESPIDLIIVTDSVNQDDLMQDAQIAKKLRVVPIAPLLARAIEKIHTENTLPMLFEKL